MSTRGLRGLVVVAGLALAVPLPAGADFTGRVVAVADGSTITVLDAVGTAHRLGLAGVAAPARGQPGGYRSKESLSRLVLDRSVRVTHERTIRDGRTVGRVWVAPPECADCGMTLDAGLAQITMGRAWWLHPDANAQSPEDSERYAVAEKEARAKKAGLWRDANPVPPWEWRKRRP